MNRLLALDLATTTGWCFGDPRSDRLHYGTVRFAPPGGSHGEIARGAMKFLVDHIKVNRPTMIVYEAPNMQHMAGRTNVSTIRVLCGLPFLVEGVAHSFGIYKLIEATTAEVRRFMLDGANPPRKEAKARVLAMCRTLGYEPKNDNEGDAISLWLYMAAKLNPRIAAASTPLFKQGGTNAQDRP